MEGSVSKEKLTASDKLGIALACLAGVFAIALFLVETTSEVVVSLVAATGVLLIYPVLHFTQKLIARFASFFVLAALLLVLGYCVFPKDRPAPTPAPKPNPPSTRATQVKPNYGNLKERAEELSRDIMLDLYMNGWRARAIELRGAAPPAIRSMPTTGPQQHQWNVDRSRLFRAKYLPSVRDIRNEFAQLHLDDEKLDLDLKSEDQTEAMMQTSPNANIDEVAPILPMVIMEFANRVYVLAQQIPESKQPL